MPQADTKSLAGQDQKQTAKTFQNPYPYDQNFEDATINLYELWITLCKRKWLIIVLTVVAALGSIVYSLQLPRVYKAEALLLPPKGKDFQARNLHGIDKSLMQGVGFFAGTEIKSEDIFRNFKQNIKSRRIQKKFVQQYGLMEFLSPGRIPETKDVYVYEEFAAMIMLKDANGVTSISIELGDPEFAAKLINDLINFSDKETINMLIEDLKNSIANLIVDIKYKINSKRLMAKKRREDQIYRYTEHAQIAKKLGMIGRFDATTIIQNTQMSDVSTGIRRQSSATTPLYYLGYEALMTEIGILRNRKSDDPFISGLRDLQEQLTLLGSIKISAGMMHSVYIDQAAYPPKSPFKPKRRVIVSVATVAGLFLAIFLVFSIEFVNNQRKKHSE